MTEKTFAVLIDTDNISPQQIDKILSAVTDRGMAMIRRAYGDWSKLPHGWKDVLLLHAIVPVQQYAYTSGKNATDFAIVIDAMDILHRNLVDGFAIVSSDSDFTPLALRLREGGKEVVGIGESKTPTPFRRACGTFVELEPLPPPAPPDPPPSVDTGSVPPQPLSLPSSLPVSSASPKKPFVGRDVRRQIASMISDLSKSNGRCFLTTLGSELKKQIPGFSPKAYGFSQLSKLLQSCDEFLVSGNGASMIVSVRKIPGPPKPDVKP